MTKLNSYYENSIASNVNNKGVKHVHTSSLKETSDSWSQTEKQKLWVSDSGLVVRNDSTFSEEEGHSRVFTWFASYADYASGTAGGTSHALKRAQLAAEASL